MTLFFPLIVMRFIVALTTDVLRNLSPHVHFEDMKIKLINIIECMEYIRFFQCKKKRRPKFHRKLLDKDWLLSCKSGPGDWMVEDGKGSQSVINLNDTSVEVEYEVEKEWGYGDDPDANYLYMVFEKEECDLARGRTAADDDRTWKRRVDEKLEVLDGRMKILDEIGKQGKVIEGMKQQMDVMFAQIMGGRGNRDVNSED
jgi:hypothetical protein